MDIIWPLATCFLMFVSFWIGRINGFMYGEDVGFKAGVEETSPLITKAILEWVRTHKDVQVSDPEIRDVIASTVVEWDNRKGNTERNDTI